MTEVFAQEDALKRRKGGPKEKESINSGKGPGRGRVRYERIISAGENYCTGSRKEKKKRGSLSSEKQPRRGKLVHRGEFSNTSFFSEKILSPCAGEDQWLQESSRGNR